jgi:hypothetical protein
MGIMETNVASKLSYQLRRANRTMKLRADIVDTNIVFSGGKYGEHRLSLLVSDETRIRTHWEGYCANNGLPRPVVGQKVSFIGSNGTSYLGTVTKVGTKRVSLDYTYRHGGAGRTNVLISETTYA